MIKNVGLGRDRGLQTRLYYKPLVWQGEEALSRNSCRYRSWRKDFPVWQEAWTVAWEAQTLGTNPFTVWVVPKLGQCPPSTTRDRRKQSVCKSALRTLGRGWGSPVETPLILGLLLILHKPESARWGLCEGLTGCYHWHDIRMLRNVNFLTIPTGLNIVPVEGHSEMLTCWQTPDVLIAPCAHVWVLLFRKLSLWNWGSFNWGRFFCLSELDEWSSEMDVFLCTLGPDVFYRPLKLIVMKSL